MSGKGQTEGSHFYTIRSSLYDLFIAAGAIRALQSEGKGRMAEPESKSTWEDLYRATILETDDTILPVRIQAVREAIAERLRDISRSSNGASAAERDAIADAIAGLRALGKERASAAD